MTIRLMLVMEFRGKTLAHWVTKEGQVPYVARWETDDAEGYVELFEECLRPEKRWPDPVPADAPVSVKFQWQLEHQLGARMLWADWMENDPPFGLPREREE